MVPTSDGSPLGGGFSGSGVGGKAVKFRARRFQVHSSTHSPPAHSHQLYRHTIDTLPSHTSCYPQSAINSAYCLFKTRVDRYEVSHDNTPASNQIYESHRNGRSTSLLSLQHMPHQGSQIHLPTLLRANVLTTLFAPSQALV